MPCLADDNNGLEIINVQNPAACTRAGGRNVGAVCYGIAVSGHYAYLALGGAGLQIFDVSDPLNCVWVGGHDTPGIAYDVAVSGRYAYVADTSAV